MSNPIQIGRDRWNAAHAVLSPAVPTVYYTAVADEFHTVQWQEKWWSSNADVYAVQNGKATSAPFPAPTPAPAADHDASYGALAARPDTEPAPVAETVPEEEISTAAPVAEPTVVEEPAVATSAPVVPAKQPNEFEKIMKAIGRDLAKAIPIADAIENIPAVQMAETVALGPLVSGLLKEWLDTALTVETSSAAAIQNASAAGLSDPQKAGIVIASMTGSAQQVASQLGASPLTMADMKLANTLALQFAGLFKVPVPTT